MIIVVLTAAVMNVSAWARPPSLCQTPASEERFSCLYLWSYCFSDVTTAEWSSSRIALWLSSYKTAFSIQRDRLPGTSTPGKTRLHHHFLTEDQRHCPEPRPRHFTLGCKPVQLELAATVQGRQQNYIICEKAGLLLFHRFHRIPQTLTLGTELLVYEDHCPLLSKSLLHKNTKY